LKKSYHFAPPLGALSDDFPNNICIFSQHPFQKKRRSEVSFNFGQYYSIISAKTLDIIIQYSSWHKTGKLIEHLWLPASFMTVPHQYHDSSTVVPGYYQVTIMVPS
jgi:hypothetical protein